MEGLAWYYRELNAEAAYAFGIWLSSLGLLWVETDPCPTPVVQARSVHSKLPELPSWSWDRWRTVRYPPHLAYCQTFELTLLPSDAVPNQPADFNSIAAEIARSGIIRVQLRVVH